MSPVLAGAQRPNKRQYPAAPASSSGLGCSVGIGVATKKRAWSSLLQALVTTADA
jgi:hypothetical protein